MLQAQMPEPVPEVEHQPVEEPPDSTPPIEDPPPGESVPTSPIPDRLLATMPEARPSRAKEPVCCSGNYGEQADKHIIAVGRAWFKKCHFQVTPEIDRALMVKGFLVLGVTLI